MSPNHGGPATALEQLARAQAVAGLDVEILCTNADSSTGTYCRTGQTTLKGGNVPVHSYSVQFEALRVSFGLATFLRNRCHQFDLIHAHGLYRFPQSYAARFARLRRFPYIVSVHGALQPYIYARSTQSVLLKRIYERLVDFPNLRAASGIHFTTEVEQQSAKSFGFDAPSFVVPLGVDWSVYEQLPKRGALRARLHLGEAPVVLFLGRIDPKKGLDILIEAFDLVHRENEAARLLVVGPGAAAYVNELRTLVANRGLKEAVVFAGPLYGMDVVQAYVDSDVFVLPSHTENFGMAVVEAMAAGTPTIISDQVHIQSEVAQAGAGLITRCDGRDVASALRRVLSETELRRSLGDAGRSLVRARYTWPEVVRELTASYRQILATESKRRATNAGT